jgi:hypothetical protein
LTRHEREQLVIVLEHIRTGRIAYADALSHLLDVVERSEREHAAEDRVNTSLEKQRESGDERQE